MAARRFADELTDIPAVMGHKARTTAYGLRWPACMLCGRAPEPIPTRGLCHACNPPVERWRSYRVDLAGQPPYYSAGMGPSGAEGVDALRSGVQLACHSPKSQSEERRLSDGTTAIRPTASTKIGGRSGLNTSTAHTTENAL